MYIIYIPIYILLYIYITLTLQNYGDKHITLYDIRAELNNRYKDLRTPYRSPTPEELFNMLTKETPQTFYIGKSFNPFIQVFFSQCASFVLDSSDHD